MVQCQAAPQTRLPNRQHVLVIVAYVKTIIRLSFLPLTLSLGYDVSEELTRIFKAANGGCTDKARSAVRLGFHDAGTYDGIAGGADGSILMSYGEESRLENRGLLDIRTTLRAVQAKFGVGYADLVQYAHNHAAVTCPQGPRIRTFVGRLDAQAAGPENRLPDTRDSPEKIIDLFRAKGFSAADVVALVGAHTIAKQRFVDTSKAGSSSDHTPGRWDVASYNDTVTNPARTDIFLLPSDVALSRYWETESAWYGFIGNQDRWNGAYARSWVKMSLLGVKNSHNLVECTRTLPEETY